MNEIHYLTCMCTRLVYFMNAPVTLYYGKHTLHAVKCLGSNTLTTIYVEFAA